MTKRINPRLLTALLTSTALLLAAGTSLAAPPQGKTKSKTVKVVKVDKPQPGHLKAKQKVTTTKVVVARPATRVVVQKRVVRVPNRTVKVVTPAARPGFDRGLELRIRRGIRTGAINPREARQLQVKLNQLRRTEARFMATGHGLSRAEARQLARMEASLERAITVATLSPSHKRSRRDRV